MLKFYKKYSLNYLLNFKKGLARTCLRGGFTLIELMVVIAIIGILSAIVLASLGTSRSKGVTASNQMALQQVKNALALYASDNNGNYPLATSSLVTGKYISAINPNIVYIPKNSAGGVCTATPCTDFLLSISGGSGSFCGDSPVAGTVCPDGTVYVSSTLRTTPSDAGSMQWANENVVTNATSMTDGAANTNNLAPGYAAAYYCRNTERTGGYTDWYLPAKNELNTLFSNRVAIGNFNTSGKWPGSFYWSSTEYSIYLAWVQIFGVGNQLNRDKSYTYSVRCVRRP
jgi:prepilin-type N-terminal cleavage/methylation domain-containing protein